MPRYPDRPALAAGEAGAGHHPRVSKATVEAVLKGTIQVLLKEGVAGLTTTKVAARAGVSVGTLYQYFPDKASLLMALKVQYAEVMIDRVVETVRALEGEPLEVAIPAVIHSALAGKRDSAALLLALREALSAPVADAVMREANRATRSAVGSVLEAAIPGLVGASMKARVLVSALEGPISHAILEEPRLLADPTFEAELCSLALGYARSFTGRSERPAPPPPSLGRSVARR